MIWRVLAVLIAVAALVDPAFTVGRPVKERLAVAILDSPTLDLPYENTTRRGQAYLSADHLTRALSDLYDVSVTDQAANTTADPCPSDAACVVVSDGRAPRALSPRAGGLGGIVVAAPLSPNVAITRVVTPGAVDPGAVGTLEVELEANGVKGGTTRVDVLDGGVVVGSVSQNWPPGGKPAVRASVHVGWIPLASGLRTLRVVAAPLPGEMTTADNEVLTTSEVVARRFNVLVYEPQPSWSGTFVRRALEGDRRFTVVKRTRLGPAQTGASRPVTITTTDLERENISAVVVSSPQLLSRAEVDVIQQVVRLRGAAALLLLDVPPTGEMSRLLTAPAVERRVEPAVSVGALKAGELIVFPKFTRDATIASLDNMDAVIVDQPLGKGRVIASGASDAWRHRADTPFDAFWQSLIADAADAAGEPLAVRLSAPLVTTGELVGIEVESRSTRALDAALVARGTVRCGELDMPVRLWPSGVRGRFRGEFDTFAPGDCIVTVAIEPLGTTRTPLRVLESRRGPLVSRDELTSSVSANGGTVIAAGDEETLVRRFRNMSAPRTTVTPVHPMRSAWWIVPFASFVGLDWLHRRRQGLP